MKKIFAIIFIVLFALTSSSFAQLRSSQIFERELQIGSVTIYNFGDIYLHAYHSNDALSDEAYIVESGNSLVMIESVAFKNNVKEFSEYVKSLGKPLVGMFLDFHPNGFSSYGNSTVYATRRAVDSWKPEGSVYNRTRDHLSEYGSDISRILPAKANLIKIGETIKLGGVTFKILQTPNFDNYSIEIPQIKAVYRHMLGANTHSVLTSIEYIDQEVADLEHYKKMDYDMILSSHHSVENIDDVSKKIHYLKTVKRIAKKCKYKIEFIDKVNEAFPDYDGEKYLLMTADNLFNR